MFDDCEIFVVIEWCGLVVWIEEIVFDIVLMDFGNLLCDVFEEYFVVSCVFVCLIVMFVDELDEELIVVLVEVGVLVYVVDGLVLYCICLLFDFVVCWFNVFVWL